MTGERTHPARARRRRAGFTLIELLVAAIMTTFVAAATTVALSQTLRARDAGGARRDASARASLVAAQLADDLRATLRDHDLYYASLRVDQGTDEGGDRLLLVTRSLRPVRPRADQTEGVEREVQYRLERTPDADDDGRSLWRRADPVPDDTLEGGGVATRLADGIVGFVVEANDGESWTRTWDTDFDGYPYAVRVAVTANDARSGRKATRRVIVAIDRVPQPLDVLLDEHLQSIDTELIIEEER